LLAVLATAHEHDAGNDCGCNSIRHLVKTYTTAGAAHIACQQLLRACKCLCQQRSPTTARPPITPPMIGPMLVPPPLLLFAGGGERNTTGTPFGLTLMGEAGEVGVGVGDGTGEGVVVVGPWYV